MKRLFWGLILASVSHALNAPYLISTTALSDSSVELSWRNNDAGTVGYILQRKDSTETAYHFLDSVTTATQLTYTDMNGLLPLTLYTYQVIAYDATSVSDTSNSVQVTTPALLEIFNIPIFNISAWHGDNSSSIQIALTDLSNCETGYRIYREQDFSSSYSMIADIVSAIPKRSGDAITWTDNSLSFNRWYRYWVVAYKSNDSLFTVPCTTYTFHYTPTPHDTVRFQKLCDYPIAIDSTGWSARSGDSIILKENPSPAGMFSVINVSNPASPVFAGYIDSTAVRTYPLQTLMPVYLNYGVANSYTNTKVVRYSDRMLVAKDSIVRMYQVVSNSLVYVDSFKISGMKNPNLILMNDTLLGIYWCTGMVWSYSFYFQFYSYFLSASGFSPQVFTYTSTFFTYTPGMSLWGNSYGRPYIHGVANHEFIISYDYMSDESISNSHTYIYSNSCWIYSLSENRNFSTLFNMPYANTFNTGHYLSHAENLCTNAFPLLPYYGFRPTSYPFIPSAIPTELFVVSDPLDPRPRVTDSINNAIYRDSVHLQNTLRNILLDTASQRVYLVFNNNLSILGYNITVGIIPRADKLSSSKKLVVLSNVHSGVTIVLPSRLRPSNLYFYDLSGRVVDKILGVTSNAVLWRPKTRSMNCFIVMVKSGAEKYTKKFMVR